MKRRGPELGDLASRFFAYMQLRRKAMVRTGEIVPVLNITQAQETDLLRRLSESGWIVRLMRGVYLVPPRIPAGGKYSPGIALVLDRLMNEWEGRYQVCGPTAFYFHGLDEQVPTVTYVYNNRTSGSLTVGRLEFRFTKVATRRLGATHAVRTEEGPPIIYSSKARTLMDAVYDWSRFDSLPRGYHWITQQIDRSPDIGRELVGVTVRYGNQATIRRVGYTMDSMEVSPRLTKRLQSRLSDSRALSPWIPGRAARGKINRKWGIIVNG
jgi:predicted transcriptional regulator of viral defense system